LNTRWLTANPIGSSAKQLAIIEHGVNMTKLSGAKPRDDL
jgi:hypothetical protein